MSLSVKPEGNSNELEVGHLPGKLHVWAVFTLRGSAFEPLCSLFDYGVLHSDRLSAKNELGLYNVNVIGCNNTIALHSMMGRSRVDKNVTRWISDFYLSSDWYNVSFNGLQYHMPGSDHVPDLFACGTVEPIYLHANTTDFDNLDQNGTETSIQVCVRTHHSICEQGQNIKVRKCGTGIQYYLEPTKAYEAYCFDPPYLQGKDIIPAPEDGDLGVITVKPSLDFNGTTPYSVFICNFTTKPHMYYTITWIIKQDKTVTIRQKAIAGNATFRLTESDLKDNKIIMGFNIICGVQVSAAPNGQNTPMNNSEEYFAGIKILTPAIKIPKGGSGTIVFQFTVPVGCKYSIENLCYLNVHMRNPIGCSSGVAMQKCGLDNITMYDNRSVNSWDKNKNYSMSINNIEKFTSDPTTFTLLLMLPVRTDHALWSGYELSPITVIIQSQIPTGKCHSRVDPHMMTADGRPFENQNKDICLLYRHKRYNIKVEEKYGLCNNNLARCTCGLRIQAGRNVFAIDGCSRKAWLIDYVQCEGINTLRVNAKTSSVWEIITPIGTTIEVMINPYSETYRWFMNVQLFMSPRDFNATDGLCGDYDGNSNNDFGNAELHKNNHCNTTGKSLFEPSVVKALDDWNVEETSYCDCPQGRDPNDQGGPYSPNCSLFTDMGCRKYLETKYNKCVIIKRRDVHSSKRIREIDRISNTLPIVQQEPRILKQRSSLDVTISEDEARHYCTSVIEETSAATLGLFEFASENMTAVISDCTFDVHMGNDYTLSRPHVESVNIVVRYMLEKDPVYVHNNTALVTEYLKASCFNNCSNNGICNDQGVCECYDNFHDGDCSIDERTRLVITDVEGDGFCALEVDEDCTCFYLYTSKVLRNYNCRITGNMTFSDGTNKAMERQVVPGVYEDAFTAYCCIPDERSKRSANNDNVFTWTFSLSISNNGESYSLERNIVVYTPRCQDRVLNTQQIQFRLKSHFCYINSECVAENTSMTNDGCHTCKPQTNQYNWTNSCGDSNTEVETQTNDVTIIVTVVVAALVFIPFIVALTCCAIKRYTARNRRRLKAMQYEHIVLPYVPPDTPRDIFVPDNILRNEGRRRNKPHQEIALTASDNVLF
ncbi:hypothetical protein DPMN_115944 [Dreissena polymorpha]|uniref:Uncharacterized protein n=2 Tax=Dreissena polymorpha TaxID=45954 RepID=A0A9D4KN10_DREPO|nr:hypothetical protein DPMN_115944 [Dreissena polymorpha]